MSQPVAQHAANFSFAVKRATIVAILKARAEEGSSFVTLCMNIGIYKLVCAAGPHYA